MYNMYNIDINYIYIYIYIFTSLYVYSKKKSENGSPENIPTNAFWQELQEVCFPFCTVHVFPKICTHGSYFKNTLSRICFQKDILK